jgi:hypothetical protein
VPKYLIKLRPGESLPSDLKEFLSKHFEPRQFEKLDRLGGRVAISIVAPYVERQKRDQGLAIDESFLQKLRAETTNTQVLQERLDSLSVAQLKKLSRLLGEPVRSSSNRGEIVSDLIRNLQSEDFWQRISSTK